MPPNKKKVAFPCGHCGKTTSGTQSLQCRICDFWHHSECIDGMTDRWFNSLDEMKKQSGVGMWLCEKCLITSDKLNKQLNILSQRVDKLESKSLEASKLANTGLDEAKRAHSRIDSLETLTATAGDNLKASVVTELNAIEDRKSNLIFDNYQPQCKIEINIVLIS